MAEFDIIGVDAVTGKMGKTSTSDTLNINLASLKDVSLTSPQTGDVLVRTENGWSSSSPESLLPSAGLGFSPLCLSGFKNGMDFSVAFPQVAFDGEFSTVASQGLISMVMSVSNPSVDSRVRLPVVDLHKSPRLKSRFTVVQPGASLTGKFFFLLRRATGSPLREYFIVFDMFESAYRVRAGDHTGTLHTFSAPSLTYETWVSVEMSFRPTESPSSYQVVFRFQDEEFSTLVSESHSNFTPTLLLSDSDSEEPETDVWAHVDYFYLERGF